MTLYNYADKEGILYDITNFSILTICLSSILYCLIVRVENYCYPLLIGFVFASIILCIIASKFESIQNSKFDELAETISWEVIKQTLGLIFEITRLCLFLLLILYPLLELGFWILSTFFPKWWPEIYSVNWITDFATKYLPYSFHPNCDAFSFFMVNLLCFLIFVKLSEEEFRCIGWIFGGILLYSFFDEQFFDGISAFAGLIGAIVVLLLILFVLAAGGGASSSSCCSSSSSNNENYNNSSNTNTHSSVNFKGTASTSTSRVNSSSNNNSERKNTRQVQQKVITNATEYGNTVRVYGENGRVMFSRNGKLHGYTSTTVSIRYANTIYVYDANGAMKYTRSARGI